MLLTTIRPCVQASRAERSPLGSTRPVPHAGSGGSFPSTPPMSCAVICRDSGHGHQSPPCRFLAVGRRDRSVRLQFLCADEPRLPAALGVLRAHQIGMSTRIVYIFVAALFLVKFEHHYSTPDLIYAGLAWLAFTLIFEWGGSLLTKRPVREILVGWHIERGFMWPYVLAAYLLSPLIVGSWCTCDGQTAARDAVPSDEFVRRGSASWARLTAQHYRGWLERLCWFSALSGGHVRLNTDRPGELDELVRRVQVQCVGSDAYFRAHSLGVDRRAQREPGRRAGMQSAENRGECPRDVRLWACDLPDCSMRV